MWGQLDANASLCEPQSDLNHAQKDACLMMLAWKTSTAGNTGYQSQGTRDIVRGKTGIRDGNARERGKTKQTKMDFPQEGMQGAVRMGSRVTGKEPVW